MNRTKLRAAVGAVVLAVSPAAALPGGGREAVGVLAVADPPGPGAELVGLAHAFQTALAGADRATLPADELRRRMEGRSSGATLPELDRAYAAAMSSMQAGDYDGAAKILRVVVDDLERLTPSEEVFAHWSRAVLRLARCEGSLGRKGEAREAMERLLRANPGATVDPDLYPPSFVRQFALLRDELRAKPRRRLVVNADGRAARVFVDGNFAGEAPVTVSVAPGIYRVDAVLGDARVPTLRVDLSQESQVASVDLSLAEALRPGAGPGLAVRGANRAGAAVAAGAALGLDRAVTVALLVDGDVRYLVGSAYDVRRGMLLREGRVRVVGSSAPPHALDALATFLVRGEASSLVVLPAREAPPAAAPIDLRATPDQGAGRPGKALTWSPLATGALAVVLGSVAVWQASVSGSRYDQARGMLVNGVLPVGVDPARYHGLVADGDAARRNAWIGGAGAAGAVIATGVLSYVSYRRTGEIGPFRF